MSGKDYVKLLLIRIGYDLSALRTAGQIFNKMLRDIHVLKVVFVKTALRCCLGKAPRAQMIKNGVWLLHLIGDKAPPTARGSNKVT